MRLGTTSCIWHDYMLPNVVRLAGRVDDVELLVFDVESDLPPPADVARLGELGRAHALSYTVHTPLDASLASADDARRARGVDKVRRAIAWGAPLAPLAYTVHVYLGDGEHDLTPPSDLDAWRDRARRSLETILADLPSRALCVECIDYDFSLIAPVVRALDLSVSLDVGHLLRDGRSLRAAVDEWLPRARILQVHGTRPDGRDHKSLTHAPRGEIEWLFGTLRERQFDGVVTLEVFDPDDLESSLALVRSLS
ncbi:MAG TPA: cobamide remodeling phosphodiesterase CbiR [Polyangia bacterium]|jgi:sugar phosphate isomerase/epimerase